MFLLALLLQAGDAPAQQPPPPPPPPPIHGGPAPTTCPVGGETFEAWRMVMVSTYGARPDGKPYSYLPFPLPIPECPGNKLVVFDDFTPAEIAALPALLDGEEYRRLATTAPTYYRAFWLATRLGRPAPQALGLLLKAIWQVTSGDMPSEGDASAAMARDYRTTFVDRVRALPGDVPAGDRLWLEARAADAARELGDFAGADALRRQALATLPRVSNPGGWAEYLTVLEKVIARRDVSIEPLDMIPDREVVTICMDRPPADAFGRAVCARPQIAADVKERRQIMKNIRERGTAK